MKWMIWVEITSCMATKLLRGELVGIHSPQREVVPPIITCCYLMMVHLGVIISCFNLPNIWYFWDINITQMDIRLSAWPCHWAHRGCGVFRDCLREGQTPSTSFSWIWNDSLDSRLSLGVFHYPSPPWSPGCLIFPVDRWNYNKIFWDTNFSPSIPSLSGRSLCTLRRLAPTP